MDSRLFEFFNTTNQTSPHYEKHLTFANPLLPHHCEKVTLLEKTARCEFVTHTKSCNDIMFTMHYLGFFYCNCDDNSLSWSMCITLMIVLTIFLFWMVYVITDRFFVPALTELLKVLNLTEYLAGITVMAISNRAPDVLMLTLGSKTVFHHVYSDCLSTCIFASLFTSSAVMWARPFAIDGTIFIRDVGFVLLFICYIDFSIKYNNGVIGTFTVVSITSIFIIYILVVVVDQYLQVLRQRNLKPSRYGYDVFPFAIISSLWDINLARAFSTPNKHLFQQFFKSFDVLDRKLIRSKWTVRKLWALIKLPPLIFWHLLIPQMNLTHYPTSWSKLLCCIQISLTPAIMVQLFIYKFIDARTLLWTLPFTFVLIILCLPLSYWAFLHSRTDCVPQWYKHINILSIVSSIMMLNIVGAELIALLKALGIILNLSDTFISCTLFTWGMGVADLTANVKMAHKGFPRMAYTACFGVTIFTIFLLLCIPLIVSIIKSETGNIEFTEGTLGETLFLILEISQITMLLYGSITNFMLRRTGAIIGMTLYLFSLVLMISSEFEAIHAFGSDHKLDRSHFASYERDES